MDPAAHRAQLRRLRVLVVLPFVASALIIAPLAFVRKGVEVDVDLRATQLSFVSAVSIDHLFGSVHLVALRIVNFDRLTVAEGLLEMGAPGSTPGSGGARPQKWRRVARSGQTGVTAARDLADVTLYDITLERLQLEPASVITLAWAEDDPNTLQLRVRGKPLTGSVMAGTVLTVLCNYCNVPGQQDRAVSAWLRSTNSYPRLVEFAGKPGSATLGLEVPPSIKLVERGVPIDQRLDVTVLEGTRRLSALTGDGATVSLPEISKVVKLAATEFLFLDRLDSFSLKSLELDNGIHATFHGRAASLDAGPAGYVRDLRPSVLEWIYARQSWLLYLNTLIVLAATLMAILRKLKFVKDD